MYQQSVGNGNIDGGSQPEFAHERNFAGFVVQCVAGNQRARPAAEQTEFVQQVFGNAAEVAAVFFIVFFSMQSVCLRGNTKRLRRIQADTRRQVSSTTRRLRPNKRRKQRFRPAD